MGILSTIGCGIVPTLDVLVFGTLTQVVVDYAMISATGGQPSEENKKVLFDGITTFAIQNGLMGLGMVVFNYLSTVTFNYTALRQAYRVRILFFERIIDQDIGWFDINQTGDFASRMSE